MDERQVRRYFNNPMAFVVTDPGHGGAIPTAASGTCSLVSAGTNQTRTLAAPTEFGVVLMLAMQTDGGGNVEVTVASAFNTENNTIITFNDVMDWALLQSIWNGTNLRWRLIAQNGCTLS